MTGPQSISPVTATAADIIRQARHIYETHEGDGAWIAMESAYLTLIAKALQTATPTAGDIHRSDCAVHNAPALPVGPCDCGAELASSGVNSPSRRTGAVGLVSVQDTPSATAGDAVAGEAKERNKLLSKLANSLSEWQERPQYDIDTAAEIILGDLERAGFRSHAVAATATVPKGWKLVPERPTQRQMDAGLYQSSADSEWDDVYSIYADMIDVAPSVDERNEPVADPRPVAQARPEGFNGVQEMRVGDRLHWCVVHCIPAKKTILRDCGTGVDGMRAADAALKAMAISSTDGK